MNRILLIMLAFTLSAMPVAAAVFDHVAHLEVSKDATCATCHIEGAAAIMPDATPCLGCHDQAFVDAVTFPGLKTHGPVWALEHRLAARSGSAECAECHQQDFCLECHTSGNADEMGDPGNNMINVHRSDFQVTHPIAARTDPRLCSSCHENSYCVDCHNAFAPEDLTFTSHRRGWSDLSVSGTPHANFAPNSCTTCHPNSVLPSHEWSNQHAREARKNLATCQSCHPEGDVCLRCHSAKSGLMVSPHPKDWGDFDDRLNRASGGKSCRKCH